MSDQIGRPGADTGGELLRRVCLACLPVLAATGVAVSTTTGGRSNGSLFASDPTAARLDELQFELGEGAGVDATSGGAAVLVSDLGAPSVQRRWPVFAPAAAASGVGALWSFPLLIGAIELGLLVVYHVEPQRLSHDQLDRVFRLAETASFALLDRASGYSTARPDELLPGDVAPAPALHRAEVYQASGMISVQLDIGLEAALARLRAFAFAQGRPVSDVARDVVTRRMRMVNDND